MGSSRHTQAPQPFTSVRGALLFLSHAHLTLVTTSLLKVYFSHSIRNNVWRQKKNKVYAYHSKFRKDWEREGKIIPEDSEFSHVTFVNAYLTGEKYR